MALLKILNCCHNLQMYCCSFHGSPPHNLAMTNVRVATQLYQCTRKILNTPLLLLLEIILRPKGVKRMKIYSLMKKL